MRFVLLILFAFFGFVSAQNKSNTGRLDTTKLGIRQIIWPLMENKALINGKATNLQLSAQIIDGNIFLPIEELIKLGNLPLEPLKNNGFRIGQLEIYQDQGLIKLFGNEKPIEAAGFVVDGHFYISSALVEEIINAQTYFNDNILKITIFNETKTKPNQPIARFTTNKTSYKIGEPVKILNYSFDPQGLAISSKFTGLEEAYFEAGKKTINLVVQNKNGIISEPFSLEIEILPEILATKRDYGLRFLPVGRTFEDKDILKYPILQPTIFQDNIPLIFIDSPENVSKSGLLYKETIKGKTRFSIYSVNSLGKNAQLVVLVTNHGTANQQLTVSGFSQIIPSQLPNLLGRVQLIDFLAYRDEIQLEIGADETLPLFVSPQLANNEGVNFLSNLLASDSLEISSFFLENSMVLPRYDSRSLQFLQNFPILERDGNHVRGTFANSLRSLEVDLANIQDAARLVFADDLTDPLLRGVDVMTGQAMTLNGNYGLSYHIKLKNVKGTVAAFSPRAGIYSGAIRIDDEIIPLPASGILPDANRPQIIYRLPEKDELDLEFIPAGGSFLPVNLVFYKI